MSCICNMKKIRVLVALVFFLPVKSFSLNIFEYSLIGTGLGIVYFQYFDDSLNYESEMTKQIDVLNEFYNSKTAIITKNKFYNLPIQEQLLVIEDLHSLNN